MKHKHPGTNIIKQLPVSAGPTYKEVEKAVESNNKRYRVPVDSGIYTKYRGETV